MTCYIIDDEPLAIEVLETHIEKYGNLKISGTFDNAVNAFQTLQKQTVDLLFLDIEMPHLSGLELLRTLKNPPQVILTTAYRDYAVEGFELDVVDYLLKPISFERFMKAMGKVAGDDASGQTTFRENSFNDRVLWVRADNRHVKIRLDDIRYIESQRDYVKIAAGSRTIRASLTISSLEKELKAEGFLRIHRSFLVPIQKIECWSASEMEIDGTTLPIGRTYKSEVMKEMEARSDLL